MFGTLSAAVRFDSLRLFEWLQLELYRHGDAVRALGGDKEEKLLLS
jgi:hypothetical protein